jgi:hypothetical protein
MTRLRLVSLASAIVLVAAGQPVVAEQMVKYSGTVLAIDVAHGQLVLEEVGPWREGVAQRTRRTIALMPETEYAIGLRANPPGGFPGEFIEGPLHPTDIEVGDMITVLCRKDGHRPVAIKIIFADTQSSESARGDLQIELERKRIIVGPRPSAEEAARDVEDTRRAVEQQRQTEQLLKSATGVPRRPDLDESVVGGVQSRNIQRVLPKK